MFAAFQLGLFNIPSVIVDGRQEIGGQCTAFYADKPIFDAPGFSSILAGDLIERLREQASSANAAVMLGQRVTAISRVSGDWMFTALLEGDHSVSANVIVLAGGGSAVGALPLFDGQQMDDVVDVDPSTFSAGQVGVYAIGDAANYPGKLRLIVSACHEAALATQAIRAALSAKPTRAGSRALRRR